MFAALFFERDPLRLADFLPGLVLWVQVAGGFAAVGLVLWYLLGLPRWRREDYALVPGWQKVLFVGSSLLSGLFSLFFSAGAAAGGGRGAFLRPGSIGSGIAVPAVLQTVAGGLAVFAVCLPFFVSALGMRVRRIYALARLSFK